MRIVQVTPILSWTGGLQEYVAGMSSALSSLGHEVVVLAGGDGPAGGTPPHVLAEDLVIRWHPRKMIANRYRYPSGLYRSIREYSEWADVVHAYQPLFVGTGIAAMQRVPLAATFLLHPEHVHGSGAWRRRVALAILLRRLDLVVAVSGAEQQLIRSVRRPRQDCVIWPGISEQPLSRRQSDRTRPLILCVANLVEAKRIPVTIRAFAQLESDCDLVIVGDGTNRDAYSSLCVEVGLDPAKVLIGGVDEGVLARLFQDADVFISMSSQESFGIAVMKAVANRCALVVTDIPSHREIVMTLGVSPDSLIPVDAGPADVAAALSRAMAGAPVAESSFASVPTWVDSAALLVAAYERISRT